MSIFINMDSSYLKLWLRTIINEEINKDQLASVSKVLGLREDVLKGWVNRVDPTENKAFSVWLLRGLKKQWIRMEDENRIRPLLLRFIDLRNANRIGDIMQYPHINDLENDIDARSGEGSKRQGFSGVDPLTLPGVTLFKENPEQDLVFYKVSNSDSLGKLGEGTKWCTRTSYQGNMSMADRYIKNHGYLIVGYKHGKPYIQFNPDYSQIMDTNDVYFESSNPGVAKTLGLPMPDVPFPKNWNPKNPHQQAIERWSNLTGQKVDFPPPKQPELYSLSLSGEEPEDFKNLKKWGELTGKPITLPPKDVGFDERFEKRLAKSILNAKGYHQLLLVMKGWAIHFKNLKRRTPMVEKSILDKDWSSVNMRYFGGGGKMRHIPGIYEIARYAKEIIKGHWPEFEDKIEINTFDSVLYHHLTNFDPQYVQHPLTKTIILYMKAIKDNSPKIKTPEFEENLKKLLIEARKGLSKGEFNQIAAYILKPYTQKTGRTIKNILGKDYKNRFYRGYVGRPHEREEV